MSGPMEHAFDTPGEGGGGSVGEDFSARISLRLPESLKASVERAAAGEGVSTNTWLVRAIARGLEPRTGRIRTGNRLQGYAQS